MPFTYIIEHMEEDDEESKTIPPWVELEYSHMRTLAGKDAHVRFTHLSSSSCAYLDKAFSKSTPEGTEGIVDGNEKALATTHQTPILQILEQLAIPISKVCLLDPKAPTELCPEDGDGRFDAFLFGGILGDDPPRDRTSELRALGFPTRHLDTVQMTTDTALGVTKRVVQDKIPLKEIPYVDFPTIRFNAKESVEMPFRYMITPGAKDEPLLPPGMRQLLHEDLNKSFDF